MSHRRPPRLSHFEYRGVYRYSVTCCTFERQKLFVSAGVIEPLAVQLRQSCDDRQFALLAYVFMPDHVHLLVQGTVAVSDFRRLMRLARGRMSVTYRGLKSGILWQDGYFERVLRDEEASETVARYIVANPLRAGLVERIEQYPYVFCWQPLG